MHPVRRFLIFLFAWSALADYATTAVAAPTMDRRARSAGRGKWFLRSSWAIRSISPRPRVRKCWPSLPIRQALPQAASLSYTGLGVHPDWGLIGGIRSALADAGYVTLSVQMPVLDANATRDDYAATLPEASARIASAVAYLRARGIAKIAIVSHSMGASMANAYLARQAVDAWAPIGMFGPFATPPKEPVLDIVAETEIAPVRETAPARVSTLPKDTCSRQITIAGADHYFDRQQKELVAAISAFLERAFGGRCAQG
jgi:pimeloyl-ACP methyl ester carboxylesterase